MVRVTVIETRQFIKANPLSTEETQYLIDHLSQSPDDGVVIQDTGGVRKLRWNYGGKGKRGGVRIIYYHVSKDGVVYLLDIYAKSAKGTLTKREKKELKDLVNQLNE